MKSTKDEKYLPRGNHAMTTSRRRTASCPDSISDAQHHTQTQYSWACI